MSQPPKPPPRGAVAGVKADLQRAKDAAHNPNGVGTAWSHNFLNQKPWHPLNYRNQIKRWEAEQKKIAEDKSKEVAKQEFEAEQEYMQTLSYLSTKDRQMYLERQSVSFMYTKPPGLDAALARDAAASQKQSSSDAAAAPSTSAQLPEAAGPSKKAASRGEEQAERAKEMERLREDPFAAMLATRIAAEKDTRFALKHVSLDTGPAYGGIDRSAPNQQILVDDGQKNEALANDVAALLAMPEDERRRAIKTLRRLHKRQEEEQELKDAMILLQSAGYDLAALSRQASEPPRTAGQEGKDHKKKKKRKRHKKSAKKKRKEEHASSSSESPSETSSQSVKE